MKHTSAVLAVDLVQMSVLQDLVNERVSRIDASRQASANGGVGLEDALEAVLLKLRDKLCRVTMHQLLA